MCLCICVCGCLWLGAGSKRREQAWSLTPTFFLGKGVLSLASSLSLIPSFRSQLGSEGGKGSEMIQVHMDGDSLVRLCAYACVQPALPTQRPSHARSWITRKRAH